MDIYGVGVLDDIAPDIIVITNSIQLKPFDSVIGRVIKWLQPRKVNYRETETKSANTVEYAPAYMQVYEYWSIDKDGNKVLRTDIAGVQLIEFRKDKMGPIVAFNQKIRATTNDPFAICKQRLQITRVEVQNFAKEGSYMKYEIVTLGKDDSWQNFDIEKISDETVTTASDGNTYPSSRSQEKTDLPDLSQLETITSIKELGAVATKLAESNQAHQPAILDAFQRRKATLLMGGVKAAEDWKEKAQILADKYYAREPQRHKDFLEAASAMMTKTKVVEKYEDDEPEDDIPF